MILAVVFIVTRRDSVLVSCQKRMLFVVVSLVTAQVTDANKSMIFMHWL